jgi:sec-independent protein translocase protein TatB
MFDLGFGELLLIAVVALVVLGPERLPKAARFAGLWVRRARAQWYSVKSELEQELASDELRRSLHAGREAMRETEGQLRDLAGDIERPRPTPEPAPEPAPIAAPDEPPAATDTRRDD